jgi:hypothetical protein
MSKNSNDKRWSEYGRKNLIGKSIRHVSDFTKDKEVLIGSALSSEDFVEKLIEFCIGEDSINLAKIVIEESRVYISNMQLTVASLDEKLKNLRVLYQDLCESIFFKDNKKYNMQCIEFGMIINNLGSLEIKNFLDQVLICVESYVAEEDLYNCKDKREKMRIDLASCYFKIRDSYY